MSAFPVLCFPSLCLHLSLSVSFSLSYVTILSWFDHISKRNTQRDFLLAQADRFDKVVWYFVVKTTSSCHIPCRYKKFKFGDILWKCIWQQKSEWCHNWANRAENVIFVLLPSLTVVLVTIFHCRFWVGMGGVWGLQPLYLHLICSTTMYVFQVLVFSNTL